MAMDEERSAAKTVADLQSEASVKNTEAEDAGTAFYQAHLAQVARTTNHVDIATTFG